MDQFLGERPDLVSFDVVGSPAVAWDDLYTLIIRQQCVADLDGDNEVGIVDFLTLLGNWGTSGPGDLDCDGTVGILDFLALLAAWGPCPLGGGSVPQTVQDCLDRFGLEDLVVREECICRVEPQECPE